METMPNELRICVVRRFKLEDQLANTAPASRGKHNNACHPNEDFVTNAAEKSSDTVCRLAESVRHDPRDAEADEPHRFFEIAIVRDAAQRDFVVESGAATNHALLFALIQPRRCPFPNVSNHIHQALRRGAAGKSVDRREALYDAIKIRLRILR